MTTVAPAAQIPLPQGVAAPVAAAPGPATAAQSSSLYVGELLPEVNEAALYEIFNAIGPVSSVRVCRDAITRRSLGYAYVNFQNPADADRALETMNFEPIHGKSCRIMWCQRDPTVRRSGVGNIFVKGLDKTIDNKALYDAFSIFGNILSVKVVCDATGQSVGRGFVHFETAPDAQEAIDKADGTLLKDKKINVAHFKSRKERLEEHGRTEHQFKNVFVKNLGDADENAVKELFAPFGEITSMTVARDAENPNKTRGFGFVCFQEFESAKRAVDELNGKQIGNLTLYVGRAMKKVERSAFLRREYENRRKEHQQRSRGVNLYVKNLDEDVDDEKLRNTFSEFGVITSARVMRDEKNNSRGFGFVCYSTQEEATRAITELNSRMIGNKPLYVALAQPKEERRQQLNIQYRQRVVQFQRGPGFMQPNMFPPQQMMYIGGPVPQQFGARQPQGFYQQRPPGAPRYGQQFPPAQFPPQQQAGFPRGPRPQGGPYRANQPPRPNTRYSNQARNTQLGQPMLQAPQLAQAAQQLTSQLASAEPERQKQILGDALYPLVAERFPDVAGKLTGMLLQMDNSEILHLLEDTATLQQELEKANEVLRQHNLVAQ